MHGRGVRRVLVSHGGGLVDIQAMFNTVNSFLFAGFYIKVINEALEDYWRNTI